jgi:isoquinoline 1-oxidoreductase beta subunit
MTSAAGSSASDEAGVALARRVQIDRRRFLIATGATTAGLALGVLPACDRRQQPTVAAKSAALTPSVWLSVQSDDSVSITVAKSEMGQGVMTSLPMLIAEELSARWQNVRVSQAQAAMDPAYGDQATAGSSSVRTNWQILRQAGAVAREMLIGAAALKWGVDSSRCYADDGAVINRATRQRLSFGELAATAATLPVPKTVVLKDRAEYKIIGRSVTRLDTASKIDGSAVFSSDVQLPGLLTAVVVHCPVFGGKLKALDSTSARAVRGVRAVITLDSGVAVVADQYWSAEQGRRALKIEWEQGPSANDSSESIRASFRRHAEQPGVVARAQGNMPWPLEQTGRRIEAEYELPFQAHATMETMCCVAHVQDGRCDIWAPTQSPAHAYGQAANSMQSAAARIAERLWRKIAGGTSSAVTVHTTLLGGGFGRRLQQDYVAEAVQISRAMAAPVRLVWSREEDMQHDFYRPANYNRLTGVVDRRGLPVAWSHKIVGPSINQSLWPGSVSNGLDPLAVEGASNIPYQIENIRVEYVMAQTSVPVGLWRSVGASQNTFVTECFLDELAHLGGQDPVSLRLHLLGGSPRASRVLKTAAEKAGWGKALRHGHAHGVAFYQGSDTYVAQIAEISVDGGGNVKVHRVVCAIDCGTVVHPDSVAAQIESGVVFGLTAALKSAITIKSGRTEQSNFHDFSLLRMDEMPEVYTHIVPSQADPGGVGELGVPTIAPAVANAVFVATGKRIRHLPIRPDDLRY